MTHQDFEKYAHERSMNGGIATIWVDVFEEKVLPLLNSDKNEIKALDYGFGDGKYFDYFCQYFIRGNIYGLEVSKLRVERAKKKGFNNTHFIKEEEMFPFEDNSFDFINVDQVIEHIPCEKIDFYVSELQRVLKQNGIVFFVVPNYPIKRFYDFYNAIRLKDYKRLKDDPTHVCLYNFKKMDRLLKKYFRHVDIIPTGGMLHKKVRKDFFSHKIFALGIGK